MTVGPRACRAWVRTYTRALPSDVAARRRAEIESDLFEHDADARASGRREIALTLEVLGRVLSGMPADLSWRRAVRNASHTRPAIGGSIVSKFQSWSETAYVLCVAVAIGIVVMMLPVMGTEANGVLLLTWSLPTIAVLVASMVTREQRPWLALLCATVGTVAAAAHWFWLPPVFLLPIATLVFGLLSTQGRLTATT
jgi:hypothetical protein